MDFCRYITAPVKTGLVLVLSMLSTACVTPNPDLYHWGDYQEIVYAGYKNPGSSDAVNDAQRLAADMERAGVEGKQVPPGVRVHLGYLYFNMGRQDEARELLVAEKAAFPAATVFIDRLLSSMGR